MDGSHGTNGSFEVDGQNIADMSSQIVGSKVQERFSKVQELSPDHVALKRKRSEVWQKYTFAHVTMVDGTVQLYARCIGCRKLMNAAGTTGTTNCRNHSAKCKDFLAMKNGLTAAPFNLQHYCRLFAQAIICHGYPLRIVEHEFLRKVHAYLNPNVQHVCRNTILGYCVREHREVRTFLLETLASVAGRVSLTCDLWTACTNRGYLTLTVQYVDVNWVLKSKILNFRYFPPPHRASNIRFFVLNLIKEWNLQGKVLSMTVDNARSMDKMTDLLKSDLHGYSHLPCGGKYFHIRCCALVLNLIVQSGLKCIDPCVSKLREIVKYIDGSDSRLTLFERAVVDTNSGFNSKLRLDVPTRWNATYLMLRRALEAKEPIIQFALNNLDVAESLDDEEWESIHNVCDLLEPFHDITELFYGSEYPTANLYFLNVIMIEELIIKASKDSKLHDMAEAMLDKFKSYWESYSVILSIAVILDPRFKLKFVEHQYSRLYDVAKSTTKVNEVKKALYELYNFYSPSSSTASSSPLTCSSNPTMPSSSRLLKKANILQDFEFSSSTARSTQSEVDSYLSSPLVPGMDSTDFDDLQFWKAQVDSSPVLAHMARDILTIPITSVASESSFSMGSRILNKYRSALLPKNVEILVTTQNWLRGYDDDGEDVLDLVKDRVVEPIDDTSPSDCE